jgi:hypothetical protein
MKVTKLVINGIEITTLDKPIGLEVNKLSLDRDFQYSCIDTKIEAELKFYCASGKTQLDAEYESKGIEALGYVDITDDCGSNAKTYRFNLDFKKYNNQGDFTTVGLIDVNSLWKQDLNKEVNLDTDINGNPSNNSSDFYVRNLPLTYEYKSENVYAKNENDTQDQSHAASTIYDYNTSPPTVPPSLAPPLPPSYVYKEVHQFIMPKVSELVNELEDSDKLIMDYFVIGNANQKNGTKNDITNTDTTNVGIVCSEIEPTPLFTNTNVSGDLDYESVNTSLTIDFIRNILVVCDLVEINEIICIGKKYDTPRILIQNELYNSSTTINSSVPVVSNITFTKTYNNTFEVRDNENVWIYYHLKYKETIVSTIYIPSSGLWRYTLNNIMFYESLSYEITNNIECKFTIVKNVANSISSSSDVEPYHTKTKAYYGQTILSHIFNCIQSFAQTTCYNDLWFSKGDLIRGKVNKADTIVKPSDFFRELEKIVCCGLGYFYDTNPSGEKRLMSVYDFYSDTLVPSQYQFDYNDLIDGKIELAPFLSPYYKEVQIGYSNFKDSPKDYSKQNTYSIDNISESTYSKISDFIASQYIITRALRLGTEDKELEFDNNIFILSGGQLGVYNATLSQTTGHLSDTVFTSPINSAGINRRYATAFNLFRHLYKWGFSLFADKDKLSVIKYEGNSIYDYAIQYLLGSATAPYTGLNACKLPVSESVKVDRTIDNINDLIEKNIYVPTQITFKTANLSSLDLIAMRAHQYDLFSVTDGVNTYYGNILSANLDENDITEIKLLRRFKNGI